MPAMQIAGHSMSTPHLTALEAVDFFARVGLDGIELSCDPYYQCAITHQVGPSLLQELLSRAEAAGIVFACLTPYLRDFNVPDSSRRAATVETLRRYIDIAQQLNCPCIRVLAGREVEEAERAQGLTYLVDSLRRAGNAAAAAGVSLVIENHPETMAKTARETVEVIHRTEHPAIGIIYDQGLLTYFNAEPFEDAIALQARWIRHVHVKDWVLGLHRRRVATVLGEGVMPWGQILSCLHRHGYRGFLSLEYEMRWHPYDGEIPSPEVALVQGAKYIREGLASIS